MTGIAANPPRNKQATDEFKNMNACVQMELIITASHGGILPWVGRHPAGS